MRGYRSNDAENGFGRFLNDTAFTSSNVRIGWIYAISIQVTRMIETFARIVLNDACNAQSDSDQTNTGIQNSFAFSIFCAENEAMILHGGSRIPQRFFCTSDLDL